MKVLDDFGRNLLSLLSENSRRSVTELALRLNTTRPRVRRGIAELENAGIIKKYSIVTDQDYNLSSNRFRAFFVVKTKATRCRVLIDKIKPWPEVVNLWTFSSRDVDLQIEVSVSKDDELDKIREKIATDPSVEQIYTMPILLEWRKDTQNANIVSPIDERR